MFTASLRALLVVPRAAHRPGAAALLALGLAGGPTARTGGAVGTLAAAGARPAYAYNCVNVVLRDPYWGQYPHIVERGWNAAGVGGAFARSGFPVDSTPSVGAIMVWPPGYYGASGTGHVALVAAVYGDGTVLVRHENWPYGTPEHSQVFAVRSGHQFVHRLDRLDRLDPLPAATIVPPDAGKEDDGAWVGPVPTW